MQMKATKMIHTWVAAQKHQKNRKKKNLHLKNKKNKNTFLIN